METTNSMKMIQLKDDVRLIRKMILEIAYKADTPTHIGPALSCVDVIVVLYECIMKIDSKTPNSIERDRFILSKGHACLAHYAILAHLDFFPKEMLWKVRKLNSPLEGHPNMNTQIGIDFSSGSLGNGLSAGLGMAIFLRKYNRKVFVILGDGECQEGVVWEAALTASALKVTNLIAIVDNNKYQSSGATDEIVPMYSLKSKWQSMNWNVFEINGHCIEEITQVLEIAIKLSDNPSVIIANTIKGNGVSFMENNNEWHQKHLDKNQYELAVCELEQNDTLI